MPFFFFTYINKCQNEEQTGARLKVSGTCGAASINITESSIEAVLEKRGVAGGENEWPTDGFMSCYRLNRDAPV